MGLTVRTAGGLAHPCRRSVPIAVPTVFPAASLNDPTIAMGMTGSEDGVLTLGVRNAFVGGPTSITCYAYDTYMKEWTLAGGAAGTNTKSFAAGSRDVFVLPENSLWYVVASVAIPLGQLCSDGFESGLQTSAVQGGLPA